MTYILIPIFLIIIALAIAQLLRRSTIPRHAPKYTHYRVKAEKHNFRPMDSVLLQFFLKGFELAVYFHPSAYYSLEEWGGDRDWYDWNKLKGLTAAFSANNKTSAMIAWRPGKEPMTFEVAAYTNDAAGKFLYSDPIIVPVEQPAFARCSLRGGMARYTLEHKDQILSFSHSFKKSWIMREVGTWMGGANNADGPFGGPASKDMSIYIDFVRV